MQKTNTFMPNSVNIFPLGDYAITIQFGESISLTTNKKVLALLRYITTNPFTGLLDIIPAYASLTITYDVVQINPQTLPAQTAFNWVEVYINKCLQHLISEASFLTRQISVPVCYHPLLAPDIEWLAAHNNLSVSQVIDLHISGTYHVYLLGFLPGFPYIGSVDERIATRRKPTPRKIVEAGSVGIAGLQTGIYPFASPGGWQLIGRTPLKIFDPAKPDPAFFKPGDEVTFYSITLAEYNNRQS